jgi:hypothetical protein
MSTRVRAAVAVAALLTACGASSSHPSTSSSSRYSGGLVTLAPDAPPTPTPAALTAYGVVVSTVMDDMPGWRVVDRDCDAFLSDTCKTTVQNLELLASGFAEEVDAAGAPGSPGPAEPKPSAVLKVLKAFSDGLAQLDQANYDGNRSTYDKGYAELEDAQQQLIDVDEQFGNVSTGDRPAVTVPPVTASGGPGADQQFTRIAKQVYAALAAAVPPFTTACSAALSDACAAAIDPFDSAVQGLISRFKGTPQPQVKTASARRFAEGLYEVSQAGPEMRAENRTGGAWPAWFADGLLRNGIWLMDVGLSDLLG